MASITIDQWIAFNDEIAALARAGIPLEVGLPELGKDSPKRRRKLFEQVASRLRAGQSLEQVLAAPDIAFPPAYRAVVAAGVRSGNLPAALESITATARRASELRKLAIAALAYPLFVVGLAYVLIYLALTYWMPVVADVYVSEHYTGNELLRRLAAVGQSAWWRIPWPPLLLALVLAILWKLDARAGPSGIASRLPTFGRMVRFGRVATFAEVLALLIEHQTPLAEALALAADASGDRSIRRGAAILAERVERGESAVAAANLPREFPPFIGWLLGGGASSGRLPALLRQNAAGNRAKAMRIGEWLSVYLPVLLTAAAGGGAAATLAIGIVGPWAGLLYQLDRP